MAQHAPHCFAVSDSAGIEQTQSHQEKYVTFFRRCTTKYAHKIQETISKGKLPNVRNYASQYRDADPELAWRMCCLWVEAEESVKSRCAPERVWGPSAPHAFWRALALLDGSLQRSGRHQCEVLELNHMFYRGLLDSALQDKCKALDPSFEYDDLRFLREEIMQAQGHLDGVPASDHLAAMSRQKLLADFALFEAELKSEQVAWHNYRVRLAEVEESELSARVELQERQQDALAQAVAEHQDKSYRTICIPHWSGVPAFLEAALNAFAGQPPARPPDAVWRINIINACGLGLQASLVLPHLAQALSSDHAHHPERTLTLVILPNTPQWGCWP